MLSILNSQNVFALEVMSRSGTRDPDTLDGSSGANTTRPKILLTSITFIFA